MEFDIDAVTAQVHKKFGRLKWGVGLALLLVIGPIAWFAVSAILGVAALGLTCAVVGALTIAGLNALPAFMLKMANMRINLLVAEAMKNPIPTLQQGIEDDVRARNEDDDSITEYDSRIVAINQQFRTLTADMSPADIVDFQRTINDMEQDLEGMKRDLNVVDNGISQKRIELKRLDAIWKLSGAIDSANQKVNARRAGEAIRKIRDDAAFAAVNEGLAKSRAQLRQRVRNRKDVISDAVPALSNNPSPVVIEMATAQASKVAR